MLVVGSIAGDEPAGIAIAKLIASQPAIPGVRLWLIPDVNPDGAARTTRVNAHGVDLNRNFPYRWRRQAAPGSRYYPGPRPGSEPETRAVAAFLRRVRPGLAIWLHQPYGLIDDSQGPFWAEKRLSSMLGLPLQRLPDYPGSAIGWEDRLVPASAFDVELRGGGHLGPAAIRLAAAGIRSLGRRFAAH
jgi:protein MpaA